MECCKVKIRSEEEKKKLISRLNRLIGQMNGVKKMIQDDRYCDDVLIQLSAIDKAIKSLANLLLENHMAIANFGGFPSITIPCGFVNNMPIGLSITSGVKKDISCLNVAYAIENELGYKGQVAKEGK